MNKYFFEYFTKIHIRAQRFFEGFSLPNAIHSKLLRLKSKYFGYKYKLILVLFSSRNKINLRLTKAHF